MTPLPGWLGPLVRLEDFDGDPETYLNRLYEIFTRDFITTTPQFKGKRVLFDSRVENGRVSAFVHITTEENHTTKQRELALRRCERLEWVRAIIEHANDPAILVWEKEQHTGKRLAKRTYLFLEQDNFLVILQELKHGNYLITAIYVDHARQKAEHLKAYRGYQNQKSH